MNKNAIFKNFESKYPNIKIWYLKKTPDEFYREMFENEKKKLREEEEKSFDDSIGNWFRRLRIEF